MSDDGRSEQSARWERLELQRLEVELDKTRAEVEKIQAEARHVHHMSRMQGVLKQATPTLIVAILGVAGPTTSWIYSQYQLEASRTEWELTFASDQLDKALADLPVETRSRTRLHFLDAYEFASNGVEDAISAGLREIDEEVAAAEELLRAQDTLESAADTSDPVASFRAAQDVQAAKMLVANAQGPDDALVKELRLRVQLDPSDEESGVLIGELSQPVGNDSTGLDAPSAWYVSHDVVVQRIACELPDGTRKSLHIDDVEVVRHNAAQTDLRVTGSYTRCRAVAQVTWRIDTTNPPPGVAVPAAWVGK